MLALSSAVSVAAPARQRERPWCRGFDLREEKVAMLVLRGIRPDTAPDGLGRVRWRRGAAAILTAAAALVLSSCSSGPVAESTVKATQAATAPVETTAPSPTGIPSQTAGAAEVITGQNEFDISNAEYQTIVDGFKIELPANAPASQVLAAVTDKLTLYFASGDNKAEHDAHYTWDGPSGEQGWNAWSNDLYTKALGEGLFVDGYSALPASASDLDNLSGNKTESNRIWANTLRTGDPSYKITVSYTPDNIQTTPNSVTAVGTYTFSSNALDNPTSANDSKAITQPENTPDVKITVTYDGTNWRVDQLNTVG